MLQVIPNVVAGGKTAFSMSQVVSFSYFTLGMKKPDLTHKRLPRAAPDKLSELDKKRYYVRQYPWAADAFDWVEDGTDAPDFAGGDKSLLASCVWFQTIKAFNTNNMLFKGCC